jgi:hypothetical protein
MELNDHFRLVGKQLSSSFRTEDISLAYFAKVDMLKDLMFMLAMISLILLWVTITAYHRHQHNRQ